MDRKLNKLLNWIDQRIPLSSFWRNYFTQYYAPKNLNFWYYFGAFLLVILVSQLITGVWLTMNYIPTGQEAFSSIEHTMRYVNYGWLIRYMHTTGASAFFIVAYLHMYRCLLYGSYKMPREFLWSIGVLLYILLMAEAYTGYVLPWGQMSFWASRVISALFMAIPFIGEPLGLWFIGDYTVSGVTLHRFFAYHATAIPALIVIAVFIHLMALRKVGSNNPDGIEIKKNLTTTGKPVDGIPFHPYYTIKDLSGVMIFIFIFAAIVFYFPHFGGLFIEPENSIPSNPLKTPLHIAPAWYLAPFYAMLRAIPSKLVGIFTLASSIAILFALPWLDKSPVKSIRYKGRLSKLALTVLTLSFISLGYLGTQPVSDSNVWAARIFMLGYFQFFILMPFYTRIEQTKRPPERVTVGRFFLFKKHNDDK